MSCFIGKIFKNVLSLKSTGESELDIIAVATFSIIYFLQQGEKNYIEKQIMLNIAFTDTTEQVSSVALQRGVPALATSGIVYGRHQNPRVNTALNWHAEHASEIQSISADNRENRDLRAAKRELVTAAH